ncbi:MAG: hypothetical protein HYR66_18620 [Sphingobacteriales bacterium]|nr:hypothetical protein [Sphingobacteriales bacterium]MBI3720559.1 hypothetical protein [Sphingobacteriales bacterium]
MKRSYISLLTAMLIFFCQIRTYGQENDTLEIQKNETGKISFIRLKPNPGRKMNDAAQLLNKILKATRDDEWKLIKENTDELSITHRRYQQYYKGIMVENAEYLVHGKNGTIDIMNGDFPEVSNAPIAAKLFEAEALLKALAFVKAQKYKWEDSAYENFIKNRLNDKNASYYPKGELLITKDYLQGSKLFKLAWKFSISSAVPDNEQLIYVDANNGTILNNIPQILDVNTPVNAQTRYSGNLAITGDTYAGGIRLNETRNGVNIHTWNANNQPNYAAAIEFNNNNANFTAANWPAFAQDQPALDAHWGAEMVLDYWRVVHNRNSLNNAGLSLTGYVHYFDGGAPGVWPNNA